MLAPHTPSKAARPWAYAHVRWTSGDIGQWGGLDAKALEALHAVGAVRPTHNMYGNLHVGRLGVKSLGPCVLCAVDATPVGGACVCVLCR